MRKLGWNWRSGNAMGTPKPSWFAIRAGHSLDDLAPGCYSSFASPHLPRRRTARVGSHADLHELAAVEQGCDRRGTLLGLANPGERSELGSGLRLGRLTSCCPDGQFGVAL